MITLLATMKALPGREEQLRHLLAALVAPTRTELACVSYLMHASKEEPGRFVLFEVWNRDGLDRHFATPHLRDFLARAPELLSEPMRIEELVPLGEDL